jgi:hypothetical protein
VVENSFQRGIKNLDGSNTLRRQTKLCASIAAHCACFYTVKLLFNKTYNPFSPKNFPKMQEMPFQRVKIQFVPELP